MGKKTISVGDVLEAMEANNIPLRRGGWFFKDGDRSTESACILGQCAINLGVTSSSIERVLNAAIPDISTKIINWNDGGVDYYQMVYDAKNLLAEWKDISVNASTCFYISKLKVPAKAVTI